MDATHTPGPWAALSHGVIVGGVTRGTWPSSRQDALASVYRVDIDNQGSQLSNAQLMAAAPDLLAALQVIVALDDGDNAELWDFDAEFSAARAAIAKATGAAA